MTLSMRTAMLSLVAGCLSSGAVAQDGNSITLVRNTNNRALPAIPAAPATNTAVTARLEKSLLRSFPGATAVQWNQLETAWHVCFTRDGRKVTAVFGEDGRLSYSICELKGNDYSKETAALIRSAYSSYKPIHAVEIKANGRVVQQVLLSGEDGFVKIKTDGDEVEVSTLARTMAPGSK